MEERSDDESPGMVVEGPNEDSLGTMVGWQRDLTMICQERWQRVLRLML